ncbi:MAG: sugar phosphate isomerase/epimerase family protein [Croceivirga sp.]
MKRLLMTCFICLGFLLNAQERYGGLALYTVRDDMAKNPKETLKQVAEIGYKNIEAAGYDNGKYYGMSPEAFAATLQKLSLHPLSTHQSSITLKNADKQFAAAKKAGFTYFVVPVPPMGMFTFDKKTREMGMKGSVEELAEILNTLGMKASTYGLKLLYHNHDFEFRENDKGVVPIDYLLENLNKEYVNFEMDLFWVVKAGANPVSYFEKYPGRFRFWHVKDMGDNGWFAPVGEGSLDFKSMLKSKEKSGLEGYFVEQDMTFNFTPMEAIAISHKALKEIGFD